MKALVCSLQFVCKRKLESGLVALALLAPFGVRADDTKVAGAPSETRTVVSLAPAANLEGAAGSSETPKPAPNELPGGPTAAKAAPVIRNQFSFGADIYAGATNLTGVRRRNTDGIRAGNALAYPSIIALNYRADESHSAHVSVGIGDLYTASGTTFKQPVEAYYQLPMAGGGTLTAGKFYVPFATQEWESEAKYGVMYQKTQGAMNYSASLNYNFARETPNAYLNRATMGNQNQSGSFRRSGPRGLHRYVPRASAGSGYVP